MHSNYAEVFADGTDGATLRVHYLDEGPADAGPCRSDARRADVDTCTAT